MKTERNGGIAIQRRVKRHTSELGAGHDILAEASDLAKTERKRGQHSENQCEATSVPQAECTEAAPVQPCRACRHGRSASHWFELLDGNLSGCWRNVLVPLYCQLWYVLLKNPY